LLGMDPSAPFRTSSAPSPHQRIQPNGFTDDLFVPFVFNVGHYWARRAVASSRLLVHDSEHEFFVLTLNIEEQVRK